MRIKQLFPIINGVALFGLLLAGCAPSTGQLAQPPAASPTQVSGLTPGSKTVPDATPKPAPSQYGGILKHATSSDPNTFDLHITGRSVIYEQASLSYSSLLQYDPADGSRIITDLAESYEVSPEGKKISFILRKNVRWHDGKPFTSDDVKFNFNRWMNPPEGVIIIRKEIVAAVERVETPDPYKVDVHLKYPNASAIPMLAMPAAAMLPPQYLKDNKTMEFSMLGTGPYKLKKYNRGISLEQVKNDGYFVPSRPYLDGITQYMLPDRSARFAAFRTGQVKSMFLATDNISPSQVATLKSEMSDRVNVVGFPGLGHTFLYVNLAKPPFTELRVRQAMDMVVDRKKAIEVIEGRGAMSGLMPPGPWGLPSEELSSRPGYRGVTGADIEQAKKLLTEAGYPDGFETELTMIDRYTKQGAFLLDQLKAIGIRFPIRVMDSASMEGRLVDANFIMSVAAASQPINDPDLFLSYALGGNARNYGRFNDKQVNEWYDEQSRTMDTAKRKELALQIQRRVLDQVPFLVLNTILLDLPYWRCIKDFYPEKQFGYYNNLKRQDIWLDQSCR